jgi:hypothetical protein
MWIRETNFAGVTDIIVFIEPYPYTTSVYYDSHENNNPVVLVIR